MREKRNALTTEFREDASHKLLDNIKKLKNIDNYTKIGVYYAFDGEMDLKYVINYFWEKNKKCFLPKLNNFKNNKDEKNNKYNKSAGDSRDNKIKTLIFCEYGSHTILEQNRFGIPEPKDGEGVEARELDLILLPLTAFDSQGHRLGMGQGYYDATLKKLKNPPKLVGIGYNFQQVESLIPGPTDVKLDAVITEKDIRQDFK